MKTYVCLALVLYALMPQHADAHPIAPGLPKECCFDYFKGKIPSDKIKSVKRIYSGCSLPGFIVTTVKEKVLCLDPSFQLQTTEGN